MLNRISHILIATAFLPQFATGCVLLGGQTGEGDDVTGPVCEVTSSSQIAWDEQTALGFSANDLLPLVKRRSIQGQWFTSWITDDPDQRGAPSPDAEPISVETTILVAPSTDSVLLVETAPSYEVDAETRCAARLEAEVTVTLDMVSECGSLHAVFPAILEARTTHLVEINAPLPLQSVVNDLLLPLEEGESIKGYRFNYILSESEDSGAFTAELAHTEYPLDWDPETTKTPRGDAPVVKPYEASRYVLAASWPVDNRCERDELSLPFNASIFDITAADAIVPWSTDLPLIWNEDGIGTVLHLTTEKRSDTVCVEDPCDDWCSPFSIPIIPFEDRAGMEIAVDLILRTEDGRWDGRLPAVLRVEILHSGGFAAVTVFESLSFDSAAEFASTIGFTPVTFKASEKATFRLELESDATSASGEPFGRMTVGIPEIVDDYCEDEQELCLSFVTLKTIQSATIGDPTRKLYTIQGRTEEY